MSPCVTHPFPTAGDSDPEPVDFIEGSLTGEEEEEHQLEVTGLCWAPPPSNPAPPPSNPGAPPNPLYPPQEQPGSSLRGDTPEKVTGGG